MYLLKKMSPYITLYRYDFSLLFVLNELVNDIEIISEWLLHWYSEYCTGKLVLFWFTIYFFPFIGNWHSKDALHSISKYVFCFESDVSINILFQIIIL